MPKLVWRVKLVAELEPGVATETEVARIKRSEEAGEPSSCWRWAGRAHRPRTVLEQSSGRGRRAWGVSRDWGCAGGAI